MPTEVARPEGGMSVDRHKNVLQPQEYTAEMFAEYFESEKARALRSSEIETIIGDDYDLARLREIVEADRAGRVKILSSTTGMTCGACDHFKRIPGTCRGHCSERPYFRDKYGHTDERRGEFMPAQSRIACKMFDRRKGPEVPDISDLTEEAQKLYRDILSGNALKGERNG